MAAGTEDAIKMHEEALEERAALEKHYNIMETEIIIEDGSSKEWIKRRGSGVYMDLDSTGAD